MKTKTRKGTAAEAVVLILTLTGCVSQNETAGTVLGGVAGNQFGKGSGKAAMTALGVVTGATVGRQIGASLDETSKRRADEAAHTALEQGSVAESIAWANPDNAGGRTARDGPAGSSSRR